MCCYLCTGWPLLCRRGTSARLEVGSRYSGRNSKIAVTIPIGPGRGKRMEADIYYRIDRMEIEYFSVENFSGPVCTRSVSSSTQNKG